LLIDFEEDRYARAVVVGILRVIRKAALADL
jgi:hypothetical protein